MVPATEHYLRLSQVANITGISRSTILRMAKSKTGPPVCRISSKILRWRESDLVAWLRSKSQRGAANA